MSFFNTLQKRIAKIFGKRKERNYIKTGRLYSRLYKYLFRNCGNNLIIAGKPKIFHPENIIVGNNVRINDGVQLSPQEAVITVGDYVTFSRGSQVVAGSLDTSRWINDGYKNHVHVYNDVYLGEGTWLGINAIILPGVKITGKGVIVAAGAIVTHSFDDDYVILGGVPAQIIKRL